MTPEGNAETVAAQADARGAYVHTVCGDDLLDKGSVIEAIASALEFPGTSGRNLDALYDCLTDLSWLPTGEHVLIWSASSGFAAADPKAYLAVRSVLSDAQRALEPADAPPDDRTLTVVLTEV